MGCGVLLCEDLLVFVMDAHKAANCIDDVKKSNTSFTSSVVFREMFSLMLSFKVFLKIDQSIRPAVSVSLFGILGLNPISSRVGV